MNNPLRCRNFHLWEVGDVTYTEPNGRWSLSAYGRNVTNEKYDNAHLLPTDYVLIILNNDLSEFGLHYVYNFGD